MRGWLVNDRLTAIPGTRTLWHHLLAAIPGLEDRCSGTFAGITETINRAAAIEKPDYIIRNAAYFHALDVECPVISFVQDILAGYLRDLLIDACSASRLVVFNSEYTRSMYPELHAADYRIIPVGTDTSIFAPQEATPNGSVLWIGSGHPVKGFDLAVKLASESARPWVFVMKDDTNVPPGLTLFRRVTQEALARIAASCSVGVCTSREETQHLAGIEMGMCGLPLVTTNVGVYHDRAPGVWGCANKAKVDWHVLIETVDFLPRDKVASYWRSEGFGLDNCMAMWRTAVESLEVAHVR